LIVLGLHGKIILTLIQRNGCEILEWSHVTLDVDQWLALGYMIANSAFIKYGQFLEKVSVY
jgi:hypothetical protein